MLGRLGMDVGLFDDVQSRGPIRAVEREAFYQLLWIVGKVGSKELISLAERNLNATRARWVEKLALASEEQHRALIREVIRRGDDGRYSVAPLFNVPQQIIGELVVFDGVARRVVQVDVGASPNNSRPSDVARRFGIEHYYEMQVFTDDSQNYPIVFCVRELPTGFPMGGDLRIPVRVAGFFFKDWQYTTRRTRTDETADGNLAALPAQFAPLLIGRAPLVLQIKPPESQIAQWVLGSVFVLAMAGFWAAAWWFARDSRKFDDRTRVARMPQDVGETLQELHVPAAKAPLN
jgi:hypothetical protein